MDVFALQVYILLQHLQIQHNKIHYNYSQYWRAAAVKKQAIRHFRLLVEPISIGSAVEEYALVAKAASLVERCYISSQAVRRKTLKTFRA